MSEYHGGYEAKIFVVKPAESFGCPLCLNILNNPRQCPNGHCFCFGCISGAITKRKECPMCKVYLTSEILGRNLFVHNAIQDMKTFCISCFEDHSSESHQCLWNGTLSEREDHFESCGFVLVSCPNTECCEKVQRNELSNHSTVCLFRKIKCKYCKTVVDHSDFETHCQFCEERPTHCPNRCGKEISRRDIQEHLAVGECPLQLVDCPYFALNGCHDCTGTVARNALDAHMSSPMRVFEMFSKQVELNNRIASENAELRSRVEASTANTAALQEQLTQLQATITVNSISIATTEAKLKELKSHQNELSVPLKVVDEVTSQDVKPAPKYVNEAKASDEDDRPDIGVESIRTLTSYLISRFKEESGGVDLSKQADTQTMQRLHEASKKAIGELENLESVEVSLPFIFSDDSGPKHLNIKLTKTELENIIKVGKGAHSSTYKTPRTKLASNSKPPVEELDAETLGAINALTWQVGTPVEYRNKKSKWIAATIVGPDGDSNYIVKNASEAQISVPVKTLRKPPRAASNAGSIEEMQMEIVQKLCTMCVEMGLVAVTKSTQFSIEITTALQHLRNELDLDAETLYTTSDIICEGFWQLHKLNVPPKEPLREPLRRYIFHKEDEIEVQFIRHTLLNAFKMVPTRQIEVLSVGLVCALEQHHGGVAEPSLYFLCKLLFHNS